MARFAQRIMAGMRFSLLIFAAAIATAAAGRGTRDAQPRRHSVGEVAALFDEPCASKAECQLAATNAFVDAEVLATAGDRAAVRGAIGRAWVAMKRGGTGFQQWFMALEGVRKQDGVCGMPGGDGRDRTAPVDHAMCDACGAMEGCTYCQMWFTCSLDVPDACGPNDMANAVGGRFGARYGCGEPLIDGLYTARHDCLQRTFVD